MARIALVRLGGVSTVRFADDLYRHDVALDRALRQLTRTRGLS